MFKLVLIIFLLQETLYVVCVTVKLKEHISEEDAGDMVLRARERGSRTSWAQGVTGNGPEWKS